MERPGREPTTYRSEADALTTRQSGPIEGVKQFELWFWCVLGWFGACMVLGVSTDRILQRYFAFYEYRMTEITGDRRSIWVLDFISGSPP